MCTRSEEWMNSLFPSSVSDLAMPNLRISRILNM